MKNLFFAALILNFHITISQTNVSGLIATNTTWTVAGSPYIVVNNLMVDQGVTLTIDPGVVVKFEDSLMLQVRGIIRAIGTSVNPITFTSNSPSPMAGDWDQIIIDDQAVGYDSLANTGCAFEFCTIEYAGSTNNNLGAINAYVEIPLLKNCVFRHNAKGATRFLAGLSNITIVRDCEFYDNSGIFFGNTGGNTPILIFQNNYVHDNLYACTFGFGTMSLIVTDNRFFNNGEFAFNGGGLISRNIFCRNDAGLEYTIIINAGGGDQEFSNNIIANSKGYNASGLIKSEAAFPSNVVFQNNSIVDNNLHVYQDYHELMLVQSQTNFLYNTIFRNSITPNDLSQTIMVDYNFPEFHFNNIYGNTGSGGAYFEMSNHLFQVQPDLEAQNNWWGTSDNLVIESLLFDWFDDASYSLINYAPHSSQLEVDAPISPPSNLNVIDLGGGSYQVSWSPNEETDVQGYKVYWGANDCCTFMYSQDVNNDTTFLLTGAGQNELIGVTAYDFSATGSNDQVFGRESWFTKQQCDSLLGLTGYDKSINQSFKLYPNPATNYLTIEAENYTGESVVSIKNSLGQVVNSIQFLNIDKEVVALDFEPGIYWISIENNSFISNQKIVIH